MSDASDESVLKALNLILEKLDNIDDALDGLSTYEGYGGKGSGLFGRKNKCHGDVYYITDDEDSDIINLVNSTKTSGTGKAIARLLFSKKGMGCILAEQLFNLLTPTDGKNYCEMIPLRDEILKHLDEIYEQIKDNDMEKFLAYALTEARKYEI